MTNDSILRRFTARPQSLVTFSSGYSGPATKYFKVPIGDARLRCKIATLFVPDAGGLVDAGFTGTSTLWLAEADKDRSGLSGNLIPATNIEGTSGAPTTIPATAGLGGYSREFVTAADYIQGRLVSTGGGPMLGTWVLQVDYSPDAVRFTDEEWAIMVTRFKPMVLG